MYLKYIFNKTGEMQTFTMRPHAFVVDKKIIHASHYRKIMEIHIQVCTCCMQYVLYYNKT